MKSKIPGLALFVDRVIAVVPLLALAALTLLPVAVRAQGGGTGTITGRVLNEGTGQYLSNAEITVGGTNIDVNSEDGGFFTIPNVPAGTAQVTVKYSGLDTVTSSVPVGAGQTVTHDFGLTNKDYSKDVIKLGEFVVTGEKEGQAKAVQEQREAENLKTVMASDVFGNVSEGNLGEFLKLMPGVEIDYNEADAKFVRIRGMDPKYATVTMNGANVATGSSSDVTTNRAFDFEQLSLASVDTIEISKTPRAKDSGSTVAGTVNVRSKGAFDHKGRQFSYQFSTAMNSIDMSLNTTPGPKDDKTYKIMPNGGFSYSDLYFGNKLGVQLTFNYSETFGEQKAETVNFANADTNPDNNATEIRRVSSFSYRDSPKPTIRKNVNMRFDYKFELGNGASLVATAMMDYNTYNGKFFSRDLGFNFTTTDLTQPYSYTTQTTTATGANVNPNGGGGATDKHGTTQTETVMAEYTQGAFKSYLVGAYSRATNYYSDTPEGFFWTMSATSPNIELSFNRGSPMDPGIYITQLAGPDWRNLANYTMGAAGTTKRYTLSQEYTAKDDMSYSMPNLTFPVKFDFGLSVNESIKNINRYLNSLGYTLLGPDGVAKTADDNPALYAEPYYRMNFDWGGNVNGMTDVDRFALARLLTTNPSWWQYPNFATGELQYTLQQHYYFVEQVNAAYLEPVIKISKKFQVTPGVRYEFSHESGTGPSDIGDPEARRILWGLPRSTPTAQIPAWAPGTGDPAYIVARYGSGRSYAGHTEADWMRYLHATYNITPDLAFRASFNQSITRPNIQNLLPSVTVNETATPYPTVSVSNPELKPEHGQSINLELEYYFSRSSMVSGTFFRTDTSNLQRSVQTLLGPDGFLGDPTYAGYMLTTTQNVAKSHISGLEFDYRQDLGFLGDRFRNVYVVTNGTLLIPDDQANYLGSSRHAANVIVQFKPLKDLSARVKFNWTGVRKSAAAPAAGATNAGWASYQSDVLHVDLDLNYTLTRSIGLFCSVRNVFDEPNIYYIQSAGTGPIGSRYFKSGAILQMGVNGRF